MVVIWSKLSHPNVLKFLGAYGDIGEGQISTIAEWMERADIVRYIQRNSANRLELVRNFPSLSPAPTSLVSTRGNSCTEQRKV